MGSLLFFDDGNPTLFIYLREKCSFASILSVRDLSKSSSLGKISNPLIYVFRAQKCGK